MYSDIVSSETRFIVTLINLRKWAADHLHSNSK